MRIWALSFIFFSALPLIPLSANAQLVLRGVIATGTGGDAAKGTVDALENAIA